MQRAGQEDTPATPTHHPTSTGGGGGVLGIQQEQCPSVQGSKPKNFQLRHLQSLVLYLPGHMQPGGQGESHLQGRFLVRDCLSEPEDSTWPLELPQGTRGPGNSPCSAFLEAKLPRDSLGNTASSSSMDPTMVVPFQPDSHEALGLQPKRSWGTLEEVMCPSCKRTHSGFIFNSYF
ncbi:hypothetical protein GW7_11933 [Heterocephalus glaber]|uniref:Uncharacterized protein n=1 Tax=Heterocephalus glaber TaxID=10181 RepID=G5ARW8_HETGA|nr:hypothetical protein GW7_11933 [Heterocephalus glaber]